MPEISQADLDALVRIKALNTAMLANPNARELLLRAAKVADPTIVNELDTAERYTAPIKEKLEKTEAELAEMRKEWLADKKERAEAAQRAQFESQWAEQETALRRAGYMDQAIAAIKELAAKKGIVDLSDAAAIYDKTAPAPTPIQSRFSALTLQEGGIKDTTDEYMKALFAGGGSAPGMQRKQIADALNEARGRAA
jgi:Skp family chaperone for outer membrane proteins